MYNLRVVGIGRQSDGHLKASIFEMGSVHAEPRPGEGQARAMRVFHGGPR